MYLISVNHALSSMFGMYSSSIGVRSLSLDYIWERLDHLGGGGTAASKMASNIL